MWESYVKIEDYSVTWILNTLPSLKRCIAELMCTMYRQGSHRCGFVTTRISDESTTEVQRNSVSNATMRWKYTTEYLWFLHGTATYSYNCKAYCVLYPHTVWVITTDEKWTHNYALLSVYMTCTNAMHIMVTLDCKQTNTACIHDLELAIQSSHFCFLVSYQLSVQDCGWWCCCWRQDHHRIVEVYWFHYAATHSPRAVVIFIKPKNCCTS